jgi:hypothetical protein
MRFNVTNMRESPLRNAFPFRKQECVMNDTYGFVTARIDNDFTTSGTNCEDVIGNPAELRDSTIFWEKLT